MTLLQVAYTSFLFFLNPVTLCPLVSLRALLIWKNLATIILPFAACLFYIQFLFPSVSVYFCNLVGFHGYFLSLRFFYVSSLFSRFLLCSFHEGYIKLIGKIVIFCWQQFIFIHPQRFHSFILPLLYIWCHILFFNVINLLPNCSSYNYFNALFL